MVKIIYTGPFPAVDVAAQPPFNAVRGEPVDVPGNVADALIGQRHWHLVEPDSAPRELEQMTNDELREILAEMGIDAPAKAVKAELVELVRGGQAENEEAD